MEIHFATCVRKEALEFIQRVYPSKTVTDTPECAGPLLDLVEKDIVRVQAPMMCGNRIAIIPGDKYEATQRKEATVVAQAFASLMAD